MTKLPPAALAIPLLLTACAAKHGDVIDREVAWANAMWAKDEAALREIMDPDFLLTGEESSEYTRAFGDREAGMTLPQWLALLDSMSFGQIELSKVDAYTIDDVTVGVDMWMYLADWSFGDAALSPLYELSDVWINRDGTWRVVTRHSRPLDVAEHGRPTPDFIAPQPDPPEPELPDAELPDAELQDAEAPEIDLPDAEMPEAETPEVDLPDLDPPEVDLPDLDPPRVGAKH